MNARTSRCLLLPLALLGGCAAWTPPSAERLAALPVVSYPDKPAGGEYLYKISADKPVELRVRADGSALMAPVEQTVSARLKRDVYLYKQWASEDGRRWVQADRLLGVDLRVSLPSHETPGPGEIRLTVDHRQP